MPSSPSSLQESKQYLVSKTSPDNEELSKFRQEWLNEVHHRKEFQGKTSSAPHGVIASSTGSTSTPSAPKETEGAVKTPQSPVRERAVVEPTSPPRPPPISHPVVKDGALQKETHMPPSLRNALEIYRRAADCEQSGNLDDAIILYRQAFRMHENVDRAFRREQMLKSIAEERQNVSKQIEESEDLTASFQSAVTIRPASKPAVVSGTLAVIIQQFPAEVNFEPEDEKEGVIFNTIPEEILVLAISKLDPTSIERFARVCRKARVLTLDSGIWRELIRRTYKPPQISSIDLMLPVIENYLFDFRRVFIEHPRIRLDGVYIAICHYVRPGLSDNQWVSITHLITYHRYLRFFPNGQVLSLLANEEKTPQDVIPLLKPTLRMKGLFVGQWKLDGTTVHLSNLIDASGKFEIPGDLGIDRSSEAKYAPSGAMSVGHVHGHKHSEAPKEQAQYTFLMTLNLRSRPSGRWNRMDIQSYESVHLETEDVHPIALKHERPFWFSKVKSYG